MSDAAAQQTSNDVFYNAPAWTQYKVGRKTDANKKVISSLTNYKDATFTLNKAVTTSREGDTWYQIASSNADLNGAYVAKASIDGGKVVKGQTTPTVADDSVTMNFVDSNGKAIANVKPYTFKKAGAAKGTTLGTQAASGAWSLTDADKATIQAGINDALQGSGYTLSLSDAQIAQIAQAKTGSSINLTVATAPTLNSDQVGIHIVSTDNKINQYVVLTKNASQTSGAQTILASYPHLVSTENNTDTATDYNSLLTRAGISGYGSAALTNSQLTANSSAVQAATYGKYTTLTVAPVNQAAFATSLTLNINSRGAVPSTDQAGLLELDSNSSIYAGSSNTTFGSLKNAILGAVKGTTDTNLTADALSASLKSVNADTVYSVYDQTKNRFLTPSDLTSDGYISSNLYADTFVALKSSLSRDNALASASTNHDSNIGAYAHTVNNGSVTNDWGAAAGTAYGVSGQALQLNYSVSKSNQFQITQNGSGTKMNFSQLYAANIH